MSTDVCVVGAGPSGLVTAKVLLEDGYDVTVFEKFDEVGGTFSSYRRYVDLAHQLDDDLVEFPDKPWGKPFASAEELQSYLREYAEEFGVLDRTEFETEVVAVERAGDGFRVEARETAPAEEFAVDAGPPDNRTDRAGDPEDGATGDPEGGSTGDPEDGATGDRTTATRRFDYVVCCSGVNHIPRVPEFPGSETFDGPIRHSSEVRDGDVLEGDRVVVVGGGKSALDLAVEAGRRAASTALVFRKANWMFPKKLLGGRVPWRYVVLSRLGASAYPTYYDDEVVRPVDRVPWEYDLRRDVLRETGIADLDEDLSPDLEAPHDALRVGIWPDGLTELLAEGAVTTHKAAVDRLDAGGVHLEGGEYVEADVVVAATGWKRRFPYLDEDLTPLVDPADLPGVERREGYADAGEDGDLVYLYRGIVPPEHDRIGFVGFRQTANNFLSMAVSAHWLSAYFGGELPETPTTGEMHETVRERLEWMEAVVPGTRGFHYAGYDLHAVDELMADMGLSKNRRTNFVAEHLYNAGSPRLYADLAEERRRSRERDGDSGTNGLYVGAADVVDALAAVTGGPTGDRAIDRLGDLLRDNS